MSGSPTTPKRPISPSTMTNGKIRSPQPQDPPPDRPAVLNGLLGALRKKDEPTPKKFQMFERMVEENDVQLARFEFLRMHCSYDGALVGPIDMTPPKKGATAIEMIFNYYASRRQLDDMTGPGVQTFDDAAAANRTMDAPELSKFCKDFFPSVFSQREVNWLFAQGNKMGESDATDSESFVLDLDEFYCLLCQMGCQLFKGGSPREIALMMGRQMGLYDPKAVLARLDLLGRTDAGFGAWKCERPSLVQPIDSSKRCVLGADAVDNILPRKELLELKNMLINGFPTMQLVEWIPFSGRYIAMGLPRGGVRKGRPARFRIVVSNTAPRAFEVMTRIEGLPFASMKYPPPRPIAPGMELSMEILLEDLPPGEHTGAVVFSVGEGGEELFRCPTYIRVSMENGETMAVQTTNTICRRIGKEAMLKHFHDIDHEEGGGGAGDGHIPIVQFADVIDGLEGLSLTRERLQLVVLHQVEQDALGLVDYTDFVNAIFKQYDALTDAQKDRLHAGILSVKLDPLERDLVVNKLAIPLNPSLAGLINGRETPMTGSRSATPGSQGHTGKRVHLTSSGSAKQKFP